MTNVHVCYVYIPVLGNYMQLSSHAGNNLLKLLILKFSKKQYFCPFMSQIRDIFISRSRPLMRALPLPVQSGLACVPGWGCLQNIVPSAGGLQTGEEVYRHTV